MTTELFPYLEAFNFLKDWCLTLLMIQTVIFISLFFYFIQKKEVSAKKHDKYILIALLFSSISIIVGLNVIGTIPWSLQNIDDLVNEYKDIYQFPNYLGVKIWIIAFCQHVSFIISMVFILFFVFKIKKERDNNER
ncbi:MAG: hypothetical protein Q3M24_20610 [Candidatus Electrothrix aestuarii]|uniref:Uncharacterized protein n=1 Tax=Candidatus Electrothrix aestuarii TaxID=3062594 RepID=A0AAU8LTP2_9BACT|nr:hypothetical protein [Candidatus Electrothrix aestuarii]